MALEDFEQIVAPLAEHAPDPDLTAVARRAMAVGTFYDTLRAMKVPPVAAREFTLVWLYTSQEDDE